MRVSLLVAAAVLAALLSLLVAPSAAAHGDDSIDMLIAEMERATEGELDFDVLMQMANSVDTDTLRFFASRLSKVAPMYSSSFWRSSL